MSSAPAGIWIFTAARALPALALGLVITFSSDHSALFGLIAFGCYAAIAGAVLVAGALRRLTGSAARTLFLVQGIVTLLAAIAALALPSGGAPYLVWVVSVWAIIAGALECVNGVRSRRGATASAGSRDWILTGALTVLLGVAVLLVPPGLAIDYTGPDEVARVLTDAVVVVGVLGAWAVIVGVQLGIAAVSLRTEARQQPEVSGS